MTKKSEVFYFQICPYCGRDAWQFLEKPYPGMLLTAKGIRHKKKPKPGEKIRCQECGLPIPSWIIGQKYLKVFGVDFGSA